MKIKVIGYKKYDFVDQKTNERKIGTNLFYLEPIDNSVGSGQESKKVSIPELVCKPEKISSLGTYEVEKGLTGNKIVRCDFIG